MTVDLVDAIVVGAGPNGLAAAIELAREGHSVEVIEAAETVGGGARSDERTLPGFIHDACSSVYPFGRLAPFFAGGWLERRGVRWVEAPFPLGHPFDDGTALVLHRDVAAMAASLGRDREEYERLLRPLVEHFDELLPDVLAPFHVPLWPGRAARLLWFGVQALQPASWHAGRFVEARSKALLAGAAAHAILPMQAPVSGAAALLMLGSAHRDGWPFPAGGAGAIPVAMAQELLSLRGGIETGHPVKSLDELPAHGVSLFDLTPRQVLEIAGPALPAGFRRRLAAFRYGPGVFKIDLALAGPIPWRAEELAGAGTLHLGGTYDEIAGAEAAVAKGQVPERPFVLLTQPSRFDPSRAPEGRHTAWAYCHVPNGSTADMTEPILGQIERFAPGVRDLILATVSTSPAALEAYNANDVGGDIAGGWNGLRQLFTRPSGRFHDPYSTPNASIFLCSASTPPGGGVHGMCGFHAARSAARRLR
ncbi:MAG: NAD(P)/FAD-dependent oxidoreductase [Chloroflexi bacterium]|nr:NAD(P)/FAD-dependent oxidoreductase [Chloroflexota bacterium]